MEDEKGDRKMGVCTISMLIYNDFQGLISVFQGLFFILSLGKEKTARANSDVVEK